MERKQTFWTVILVVYKITTTLKGKLVTAEQDTQLFNSANCSIWVTTCLFRNSNLATGVPHYSERSLCVLSRCPRSLVSVKLSKTCSRPLSRTTGRLKTVTLRFVRTTHALLRAVRRHRTYRNTVLQSEGSGFKPRSEYPLFCPRSVWFS